MSGYTFFKFESEIASKMYTVKGEKVSESEVRQTLSASVAVEKD